MFEPQVVKKRQRRLAGVDELVISLAAQWLTTAEIAAHFADVYGAKVSRDTISRITDRVLTLIVVPVAAQRRVIAPGRLSVVTQWPSSLGQLVKGLIGVRQVSWNAGPGGESPTWTCATAGGVELLPIRR